MKNLLLKTFTFILILLSGKTASAQAFNANFGYTINCRTITLTDSSTGSNNSYFWTFGDGSLAYNDLNPQHTYNINGNYNVTLIITCYDSSSGNFLKQDTMAKQITINCATCNIKAEFSSVRDQVIDKKMIFTNYTAGQSTYNSIWDFGYSGNGGSTVKDPVHTFPSAGQYYVKLKAWYFDVALGYNCFDSIVKEVSVNKLRANFGYRIDSVHCSTVTFTDSSLGSPQYHYWEFGDNMSAAGANPVYTYSIGTGMDTQVFNVRLRIYYVDSVTSSYFSDTIIKQVILPPCNICQINASIQLDGDSTVPFSGILYNYSTGIINKHYWDFGDGGTSTSNAPVHSYANPGTYTITYIAMDTIKNCRDTAWTTFTIDSAGFLKRQAFVLTVVDRTTTGISKQEIADRQGLKAYPNPANSFFILEGIQQKISVYNLQGARMGEYQLNRDERLNIDTSDWARGLYIIIGDNHERIKLILE